VNAAEVVVQEVQGNGGRMVVQLLAEAVGQSRKRRIDIRSRN
jgi:hypothetical protein